MATLPLVSDEAAGAEALAVFDDIRAKRNTDYVNNFWRALAHDPDELKSVWDRLQTVMAPGTLDPLVKELIYIAVSATNGCAYCVHSHTSSAKAKGMTPERAAVELQDPIMVGTMMLALDEASGLVSGAVHSTAHTIRKLTDAFIAHSEAEFADNAVRYEATLRFINGNAKTMLSAIQGQ